MLKNIFKFLIVLIITITYANALQENEIQEQMTKKIDNVLLVLEKKELSLSQKGEEIIKIIDEVFDYELMAKIALGKETWNNLSVEKQKEFVKIFETKLMST